MDCNLEGRIRKYQLNPRKGLWPLFEAVVNSIQAIEDRKKSDGAISIHIGRDSQQSLIQETDEIAPIQSFKITDNGIGFTDANYTSFKQSDSIYKINRGGKGVGRLLWLVAFENVTVQSVYQRDDKLWRRAFEFGVALDGSKETGHEEIADGAIQTTIYLSGFKDKYRDSVPKHAKGIAEALLEHCLQYFLHADSIRIEITDDASPEKITVNDLYKETVGKSRTTQIFEVGAHKFQIDHLRSNGKGPQEHSLHFCAHKRSVIRKRLCERIPNLGSKLPGDNGNEAFVYTGYVSGDYLDKTVNPERTNFQFSDDDGLLAEELTEDKVTQAAVSQVEQQLEPQLSTNRKNLEERIVRVISEEMPEARPLLRNITQVVRGLSPSADERTVRRRINEAQYAHEAAIRESVEELVSKEAGGNVDMEKAKKTADEIVANVTETSKGKLLSYVAFRKAILTIYEKQIGLQQTGKFSKENAVHEIIFPRRSTSDELEFDEHNLWIIDDKLAFHQLLASDVPFDEIKQVQIGSKKRCDLLVINKPAAFAHSPDAVSSVVIVELKRPERDDYTLEDNPLDQVLGYIEEIRAGRASDTSGRTITLSPHTPFFVYIISDLTPTLLKIVSRRGTFVQTPDAQGFFGYQKDHHAYVEIASFAKLIADAKKRNRVWFKKLGIE